MEKQKNIMQDEENLNLNLPHLKKIEIIDYSLYQKNIVFNFVDGINLIIGANGTGKTTFINIVKYALIGAYKSKTELQRTYMEKPIIKRKSLPNNYFRNRMSLLNENAYTTLEFKVKDTDFIVKRSLYENVLLEAKIMKNGKLYNIDGSVKPQKQLDLLKDDEKGIKYLQYNFEQQVARTANMPDFDTLIFFMNNILLFGEDRQTIFWEEQSISGRLTVQEQLYVYYLLPEKSEELFSLSHKRRYYDSVGRHKTEDKRALKLIYDKYYKDKNNSSDSDVLELHEKVDKIINKQKTIDNKRKETEKYLKNEEIKCEKNNQTIHLLEKNYNMELQKELKIKYGNLHPDYNKYKNVLYEQNLCPFCNQSFRSSVEQNTNQKECFFCHQEISVYSKSSNIDLSKLKSKINKLNNENKKIISHITLLGNDLDEYDSIFSELDDEKNKIKIKIRSIERVNINSKKSKDTDELQLILLQINALEKERKGWFNKRDLLDKEMKELVNEIENMKIKITRSLSKNFSKFVELFIGFDCKLIYDSSPINKNYKRFLPVIDGIARYEAEELSESQRFFIEQSFRLAILDYFYTKESFFICETPDSSLDISYEYNAATTLLKFLEKSNSLILTCNLNNSNFLKHIFDSNKKINILDLYKLGKTSQIQKDNIQLQEISKRILEELDERK